MPTFELRGFYVSNDVKFANDVTTTVDQPNHPTREQAEIILFPLALADLERCRGGADDLELTAVEIDGSPAQRVTQLGLARPDNLVGT